MQLSRKEHMRFFQCIAEFGDQRFVFFPDLSECFHTRFQSFDLGVFSCQLLIVDLVDLALMWSLEVAR